jgi:hypothetical protein
MSCLAKLSLVIVMVLLTMPERAGALGFTSPKALGLARLVANRHPPSSSALQMGWFDFNPMRGSGSGGNKEFLDEQFEAQQAILRARQQSGLTKDSLKKKYEDRTVKEPEEKAPVKEMAAEEATNKGAGIKLPWEK